MKKNVKKTSLFSTTRFRPGGEKTKREVLHQQNHRTPPPSLHRFSPTATSSISTSSSFVDLGLLVAALSISTNTNFAGYL
ncbi:conserved hypothetical protein [Ricinus communis]|uniref:Uncharacterized protein n=1 Tax=Ricinus communis TaxID=3988 RepID=B9REK7_RICCO|nr:conserved hypothetical protein [Ricinus communis]